MDPLQPFIFGVPEETLIIPKERAFISKTYTINSASQVIEIPQDKKFLLTYCFVRIIKVTAAAAPSGLCRICLLDNNTSLNIIQTFLNGQISITTAPLGASFQDTASFDYPIEVRNPNVLFLNAASDANFEMTAVLSGYLVDL